MVDDTMAQRSAVTCLESHSGSWQGQNSSTRFFWLRICCSFHSITEDPCLLLGIAITNLSKDSDKKESGFSNTLLGWVINMPTFSLQSCVDLGLFYGKYNSYIYFLAFWTKK